MNALKLILRGATYYRRTHLGVAAGAAVGAAVLVGALVVGDSVRYSLRALALRRLGAVEVALSAPDRFFRAGPAGGADDLAGAIAAELRAPAAPVLMLDGSARTPDGAHRANRVQVLGVDARFWRLGGARDLLAGAGADSAVVNAPLAEQLGRKDAAAGWTVNLRVPAPTGLPKDAPLAREKDAVRGITVTVRAVAGEGDFGRFSLRANQLAPMTVFLPLEVLQRRLGVARRANVLLLGRAGAGEPPVTVERAGAALRKHWRLADADLYLRRLGPEVVEVRTGRVFLDGPAAAAAAAADQSALRVLTYFVDEVRLGAKASPYCIVAAMDPARADGAGPASPVPEGMGDDEILLNEWLAEDIGARPGQDVRLTYSTVGPMRTFVKRSRTFRVRAVVPIAGPAADPNLMPDFPGLAETKSCFDWDPGIPIDLEKLKDPNDKYNRYWLKYRGTPKAFVTLRAGREMWANRFGDLTAVRYRLAPGGEDELAGRILSRLDPNAVGLYFQPVRRDAVAAAEPTSDFGGLFLGLSFFLIVSALLLTGLLFVFGVEQRSREVGTLLALGFRPGRVRRLLLAEGGLLAVAGTVVGSAAGLGYTRAVLHGVAAVWRGVSPSSPIRYHAEPATVAMGAAIALAVSLGAMWLALRLQGRASARELLAAGATGRVSPVPSRRRWLGWLAVGAVCAGGAAAMVAAGATGAMDPAGAFFGCGGLLLVASLCFCWVLLAALGRGGRHRPQSLLQVGVRTAGRRRGRSLATVGLLACGVFLVAAVEVFRQDPNRDATRPTAGTGGFALYGESALPILHDLNDPARRERLGLDGGPAAGARVVQLRLHDGDDASCLNLNRARQPRILGVDPARLAGRFTFVETLGAAPQNPWMLLAGESGDGAVPAVGDHETLMWALHKSVGDVLEVRDERGRAVKLKLVGSIAGSIFQGSLLISEGQFGRLYPSSSGYRVVLIDAPADRTEAVRAAFGAALEDVALELTTAAGRLGQFLEVQNTYLSIFAALGGLGLVVGSVALGIVVLRNVLERRGELALLRAVGFSRGRLRTMVLVEHWMLLAMGLDMGVVSAVVAVVPALGSSSSPLPVLSWVATLGGIVVSGVLWTYLAARAALRGELLEALRTE